MADDAPRVPMILRTRPWTPATVRTNSEGRRFTTIHVKRACNGCGALLGDVTEEEINAASCGCVDLPDVRAECPFCPDPDPPAAAGAARRGEEQ